MAEIKPLMIGATGLPTEADSADTIPVSNVPTLTAAKISDFDEAAQDAVGAMVDTDNLTYTDGTPLLSVKLQMSLVDDASGIKLDGDASTPGNSKYYGTNSGGTKGFYDLPTGATGYTMTAGENLAAGDLIYVAAAGTVFKADANTAGKEAVGFVTGAISSAASGTVYFGPAVISGYTSLTPGAKQFLSATTTGAFSTTVPSGTSDLVQLVGWAKSATELFFIPQAPMIRAAS